MNTFSLVTAVNSLFEVLSQSKSFYPLAFQEVVTKHCIFNIPEF